MTGPSAGLVAVRYPLGPGPPIDPFTLAGATGILFHAEGRVLVGLGTALTVGLPDGLAGDVAPVTAAMAAIGCQDGFDASSAGVMGFASLPFERTAPAVVVVPEVTYGSEADGREWVTVVAAHRAKLPGSAAAARSLLTAGLAGSRPIGGGTAGPSIEPRSTDTSFVAMVEDALATIDAGELVKVVLARQIDVVLGAPVDVPTLLRRWHELEPNCTIFSVPTPNGQFVGASPELLVERTGNRIHSRPLAGTAERFIGEGGSLLPEQLLESRKDATEHRLVVNAIEAALRPLAPDLETPPEPDLVHLRNIVHLGTSMRATLGRRPDGSLPGALELVQALHPTPAVGGVPAGAAVAAIGRLEPEPRGRYAGPVGYVDATGDGRWMVGIRAMTIDHLTARLAAGVGIVAGSVPSTELAEANLKLTAVLDALAPGLVMPPVGPPTGSAAAARERQRRTVVG